VSGEPIRWVLDASVGIKLVVFEDDTEKAETLIQNALAPNGPAIYVPDIFFAECSNVLWKYTRKTGQSVQAAKAQLSDLSALPLQTIPTPPLMMEAFDTALKMEISAYDALYVVLASTVGGVLVTADRKLASKIRGSKITVDLVL